MLKGPRPLDWVRTILLAVVVMGSACSKSKNATGDQSPGSAEATPIRPFTGQFANDSLQISPKDSRTEELIWAIGDCDCLAKYLETSLKARALQHGALPQALMPPIRQQIRNNDSLKTVLDVPLIGGLLADVFVNDDKISGEVRTGIQQKISQFVPGGSQLDQTVPYRFDGFRPIVKTPEAPKSFLLADQISHWHLYFAHPGLWQGQSPIASGDHGLQGVEVMRTLVEWKYLFGLDSNPEGGHYGGLSIDLNQPTKPAGKFDPRESPDAKRFFNGKYTIEYPEASALDLATKTSERWRLGPQPITLNDQAKMWLTAAKAFHRLRPENRNKIRSMFGAEDQAIFPTNAHELTLAFLPGLQGLLSGPFIEKESRLVRQEAFGEDTPASLLDLARLIRGIQGWVSELSDLRGSDLPENVRNQLREAPAQMVPAIQVAVQTILKDHIVQNSEIIGNALVEKPGVNKAPTIAVIGEVIVALVEAETQSLSSPLLHDKVEGLGHWLIGEVLQKVSALTPESAAWSIRALNALEQGRYKINGLKDGRSTIKSVLSKWEVRS
jgi:hypothetical protein